MAAAAAQAAEEAAEDEEIKQGLANILFFTEGPAVLAMKVNKITQLVDRANNRGIQRKDVPQTLSISTCKWDRFIKLHKFKSLCLCG